uniref:Tify domain-containing protein n=1 Tax=Fagus sylvatica TaxID=28930 RepID=A0A2N9GYC9_FAGSY
MSKGAGHVNDGDPTFDSTSRIEPKRSHQWFLDAAEAEVFPNKKQAVQAPNNKSSLGMSNANVPSWENPSSFHSVPSQFNYRLFGSETARSVNFAERNISPVGTENPNVRRKSIDDQFGEDASVGLSISHAMEDPETCLTYGGIRKVKVNQVKDCDNGMHILKGPSSNGENISHLSSGQAYNRESEAGFASMGQSYNQDDSVTLMGHTYNRGDANIRSTGPTYGNGDDNSISMGDTYSKGEANLISFGGFPDEQDIIPVGRPVSSYDLLYNQSSVQTSETAHEKESDASNAIVLSPTPLAKSRPESVSKNKPEFKTSKKEAPNSFPSNVRSLISTGMLDGVPVKYVSLAREELRGIIKGSGYLCGCQSCNFSKSLNAYEFERHAGCKTKHPNNHIYFENGKTIYQIVQELKSTPESLLFDAIQTVFGAPINQKSFRIWKESFQAATRELQRIYGKEELNL